MYKPTSPHTAWTDEPPRHYRHRANPCADGIVYPCGAVPWVENTWLVSYGVHDERCCLRAVHHALTRPHWPYRQPPLVRAEPFAQEAGGAQVFFAARREDGE